MDLVLALKRQWGWRFVDEFCWRNTRNGCPGGWNNRFKNAWEPVFHFAQSESIKFNPDAVCTPSDDVFEYSPDNPKSESGSGLLGSGKRKNQGAGMARPSNVIEAAAESGQGSHSAPFPRGLVEFFVKAFSDAGDVVYDPFTGSGTSIAAAHVLERVGLGCEISPAYCDVSLRRLMALIHEVPVLQDTGQTFAEVAQSRCVPVDDTANPKLQDVRKVRHNGLAPFYGSKRKVG
jgi:site-specific DNA-methyltransferase (adenine-specific)/site-specific DNA-methyltransferase (cytosine-N4-specific)